VVDVARLVAEIEQLRERGIVVTPGNLAVSGAAHVVTPGHRLLDELTGGRIGTTGQGVGPTYADKARRSGLRLESLLDGTFEARLDEVDEACLREVERLPGITVPELAPERAAFLAAAEKLRAFVTDTQAMLVSAQNRDARILFEGVQGTLLDVDHGTYPFVTSTSTTIGGALTGTGVFIEFQRRIGVTKAYTTRVGNGPFPTEEAGEPGARLRARGHEYGSTTGRPRRCGWLDLHLLERATTINGFNELTLTKLDCLSGLEQIPVAVGRDAGGRPVYEELPGWAEEIGGAERLSDLPQPCREYVRFIERRLGVRVTMISIGAAREALITRNGDD
jgi:adenylosuccinate synthase